VPASFCFGLLFLDMRATLHSHGLSCMHYTIGISIMCRHPELVRPGADSMSRTRAATNGVSVPGL